MVYDEQAKKFLSHPVVAQQLDAIWAGIKSLTCCLGYLTEFISVGNIVFYSLYDEITQRSVFPPRLGPVRRSASIYDGSQASLFKLSRLRIPRYRHILSTGSLAVLLFLYACGLRMGMLVLIRVRHLSVLVVRSKTITPLEILFWLWSSGFMLVCTGLGLICMQILTWKGRNRRFKRERRLPVSDV